MRRASTRSGALATRARAESTVLTNVSRHVHTDTILSSAPASRNVVHLVQAQAPSTHHATLKSTRGGTEIHIIIIITSDSTGMRTRRFRQSKGHNCQLPFTAYFTQYASHSMFRRCTMSSTNIPHSRTTFSCIYVCTTAQSIQARAESIQLSRQCNTHMEKLALASSRSQSESPFSPFSGPESPFSPFSGSQILPIS